MARLVVPRAQVFMNDLGEDVKDAQDELRGIFLDALKKVDEETNGKVTGWLLKSDMRIGLRTAFKHKTEYQMAELYDALDSDEPRQLVNYFRWVQHGAAVGCCGGPGRWGAGACACAAPRG